MDTHAHTAPSALPTSTVTAIAVVVTTVSLALLYLIYRAYVAQRLYPPPEGWQGLLYFNSPRPRPPDDDGNDDRQGLAFNADGFDERINVVNERVRIDLPINGVGYGIPIQPGVDHRPGLRADANEEELRIIEIRRREEERVRRREDVERQELERRRQQERQRRENAGDGQEEVREERNFRIERVRDRQRPRLERRN